MLQYTVSHWIINDLSPYRPTIRPQLDDLATKVIKTIK